MSTPPINRNLTPFEQCLAPIARSKSYDSLLVDDLEEAVNNCYKRDAERASAIAQDNWIREYRFKMFRKVVCPHVKLKTEKP